MSLVTKFKDYILGAYAEMLKVVWPTKKQTINYTALVVVMSIGMAVFFGVLDYVFNLGLEFLIR